MHSQCLSFFPKHSTGKPRAIIQASPRGIIKYSLMFIFRHFSWESLNLGERLTESKIQDDGYVKDLGFLS